MTNPYKLNIQLQVCAKITLHHVPGFDLVNWMQKKMPEIAHQQWQSDLLLIIIQAGIQLCVTISN